MKKREDVFTSSLRLYTSLLFSSKTRPSAERLRQHYWLFKERLSKEPAFMKKVIDLLPMIAARYDTTDFVAILADKDFLTLLVQR